MAVFLAAGLFAYRYRWEMQLFGVPNAHAFAADTRNFELQRLPSDISICMARGKSVYYIDRSGNIHCLDDDMPVEESIKLGTSPTLAPLLFHVTRRGSLLVGGSGGPIYRSDDAGKSWQLVHHCPCWRADEDDIDGVIYAGNYTPVNHPVYRACLFRSMDDGRTWEEIFRDPTNHHVHSVRLDHERHRIILCVGDSDTRGEVCSGDLGKTWTWLRRGGGHGNTAVVITPDYAIWGSDDHRGRIYRTSRDRLDLPTQIVQVPRHQIWDLVADGKTVYAGTLCEHPECTHAAHLLASQDQGESWQNILELPSPGNAAFGFVASSRRATEAGWVYFAYHDGSCYRVRRTGEAYRNADAVDAIHCANARPPLDAPR